MISSNSLNLNGPQPPDDKRHSAGASPFDAPDMTFAPEYGTRRPTPSPFAVLRKQVGMGNLSAIAMLVVCLAYYATVEPLFVCALGIFSLVGLTAWHLVRTAPAFYRLFGHRMKFWHVALAIVALTGICSFVAPIHAIFLSGLEAFFVELVGELGAETITEDQIALIFNVIRGVFLLLVAAASLYAYNQAQQGNDWRPIITQVALAFGIVITIDLITAFFIGDAGGSGP